MQFKKNTTQGWGYLFFFLASVSFSSLQKERIWRWEDQFSFCVSNASSCVSDQTEGVWMSLGDYYAGHRMSEDWTLETVNIHKMGAMCNSDWLFFSLQHITVFGFKHIQRICVDHNNQYGENSWRPFFIYRKYTWDMQWYIWYRSYVFFWVFSTYISSNAKEKVSAVPKERALISGCSFFGAIRQLDVSAYKFEEGHYQLELW